MSESRSLWNPRVYKMGSASALKSNPCRFAMGAETFCIGKDAQIINDFPEGLLAVADDLLLSQEGLN